MTFHESIELSRNLFISLGAPGLFLVAFLEFFMLPIIPDLVLIPLVAANPPLAFFYASVATVGSVTAGLLGYFVGYKGGRPALEKRYSGGRIEKVEAFFERYGLPTIVFGAFAPIPEGFELLSYASGVFGINARLYLFAALLGRGSKYFLEASIALALGEAVRSLEETTLYKVTGVIAIVGVLIFIIWHFWSSEG